MDEEKGWIKIHRSIFRNPWMLRPNVLAVWMYILGRVNWRPTDVVFEGKRITLQPGQGIFKVLESAADLRIPETTTRRIVNLLKSEGQIGVQTSPRNTLITVVNWSKYQLVGGQNGGQVADKRRTSGGQTGHLPIIKEREEGEEGEETRARYGPHSNVFLTAKELQQLQEKFPDWQQKIDRLSVYMQSSGKKYADHFSTICYWADQDSKSGKARRRLSKEDIDDILS